MDFYRCGNRPRKHSACKHSPTMEDCKDGKQIQIQNQIKIKIQIQIQIQIQRK